MCNCNSTRLPVGPPGPTGAPGDSYFTGEWESNPFNAGDYTADTGNWTVGEIGVVTNRYKIAGKTMFWTLYIDDSELTATPNNLSIVIPEDKTFKSTLASPIIYCVNNGDYKSIDCHAYMVAGGNTLGINSALLPFEAGLTAVGFTLVFEIE